MHIGQLFAMGGYGPYVWSAYSITFLIFAVILFLSRYEKKRIRKLYQQYLVELASRTSPHE